MITITMDPDIVRWGLHELYASPVSKTGSSIVTRYNVDLSYHGHVEEGYCENSSANVENDEVIARALQEELSKIAVAENAGCPDKEAKQIQESILSQNWPEPFQRTKSVNYEEEDNSGTSALFGSSEAEGGKSLEPPNMTEELLLDGEVGKRLNQMVPVRHVPKINGLIPSEDDAESDHQRLLDRLKVYDLVELKVRGDGNCQFRALSDQIYRSTEYHFDVRKKVVNQLRSRPDLYEGYVPMQYAEYLNKMSRNGEWGDHVTLQAAADVYGFKMFVLTSFKDTCYIEILPRVEMSKRVICLSFWAEVHYNSIYPEGELPPTEKKRKWWVF